MELKDYSKSRALPGLPDTGNVTDPQLRLFLDRIKSRLNEQEKILGALTGGSNDTNTFLQNLIKNIVNSQEFVNALTNVVNNNSSLIEDIVNSIINNDTFNEYLTQNITNIVNNEGGCNCSGGGGGGSSNDPVLISVQVDESLQPLFNAKVQDKTVVFYCTAKNENLALLGSENSSLTWISTDQCDSVG